MNTKQIHIFFKFSKVIGQFVWLFPCFLRVAKIFVNLKLHLCYITLRIKTKTISRSVCSSQILPNAEINIVVHRKFWRKHGSVLYLFSCTYSFKNLTSFENEVHRDNCKRKLCEFAETYLEKLVKSHLVNLFSAGFRPVGTTVRLSLWGRRFDFWEGREEILLFRVK